jgi:ADP-ribosylglycohydrolase
MRKSLTEIESNYLRKNNRYVAAVLGLVVGDALGVPAEFKSRVELKANPVTDIMGYGTHNQPAGTWSDDSSMTIASMEWLSEMGNDEPDYNLLMDKFSNWLLYGDYTPYGNTFDCGIATSRAIMNYGRGTSPLEGGGKSDYDNGNGSLMRILPIALWKGKELAGDRVVDADFIFNLSALTHAHLRSKMACLIYSKLIADLLYSYNEDKFATVQKSLLNSKRYLATIEDKLTSCEFKKFARLWDLEDFQKLEEQDIKSTGYVVDTLEAAIWCFLNTDNYKDCVLKAVNLGNDTDTVGAVAGGLAGLYYRLDEIPVEWITLLPKKEWIIELAAKLKRD